MRRLVLIAATILALSTAVPALASARRFEGYVGGAATGRGHSFVLGDGLELVFVDRVRPHTRYRVCWHLLHHPRHRCRAGETGAAGHRDSIFTAAPGRAGRYLVKWTVRHHRRAAWSFTNGIGD